MYQEQATAKAVSFMQSVGALSQGRVVAAGELGDDILALIADAAHSETEALIAVLAALEVLVCRTFGLNEQGAREFMRVMAEKMSVAGAA